MAAAGENRLRKPEGTGRHQDENIVGGRLLQGFQKGVGRGFVHFVRLIDDEDALSSFQRPEGHLVLNAADVVDADKLCLRLEDMNVRVAAVCRFPAGGALAAGILPEGGVFTVLRLREFQGQRFFADARKSAENVRMPDPLLGHGFLQHGNLFRMAVNICK